MSYTAEDFTTVADSYDRPHVPGYLNEKIICAALRIAARVMEPGILEACTFLLDNEQAKEDADAIRSSLTKT